jgi:hypothetical protein
MTTRENRPQDLTEIELELEQTLGHFRESVHAWSEKAYRRPHVVQTTRPSVRWRLVWGAAVGCLMAVVCVDGALYARHHSQAQAVVSQLAVTETASAQAPARTERQQARESEGPRGEEAHKAAPEKDLLAMVDRDVSRQIPAVLDPLAQWMDDSEQ